MAEPVAKVAVFGNRRTELARLSDMALRQALVERLRAAVAEAAQRRVDEVRLDWVDPDPLPLWLALQPYVLRDLGFQLLPFDLPHCHSIPALAAHLVGEVRWPPAPAAPMGELYQPGWPRREPLERRYGAPLHWPIAFLLSPPRSGSTLLCAMLGRHPRLYGAQELTLLPFESMGARVRQLGPESALLRKGLFFALRDLAGMTEEQAERECLALEAQDVAVSAVYRRLQELAGSRIIVDKSPGYAGDPAWLASAERVFRTPRYIHLTRHPSAVIESFVRRRFHRLIPSHRAVSDENPWLFAEKVWTSSHLHCVDFLRGIDPSRQLRVSYEALIADPRGVIGRICDLLQIPFDAATLEPYASGGHEQRLGDPGFRSRSGIDRELRTDWQRNPPPQSLGRVTREVAAALGYSVP
jgi:hypothetical protein